MPDSLAPMYATSPSIVGDGTELPLNPSIVQRCLPVARSNASTVPDALATTAPRAPPVAQTAGVVHPDSSFRSAFHWVLPVAGSSESTYEPSPWATMSNKRPSCSTGDVPTPWTFLIGP